MQEGQPGMTDELSAMGGWQALACPGDSGVGGHKCVNIPQRNGFGVETGRERTSAGGRGMSADRKITYMCSYVAC